MASITSQLRENNLNNERLFHEAANMLIEKIMHNIESCDDKNIIDYDYSNEVLMLEINAQIYVINKQSFKREIWLSSPISGPHHFIFKENQWINNNLETIDLILSKELSDLTQQNIII
ncbi:MAG: iron donor protein CyaY [Rickettsiaceae bacterium]|nr:iron donor protein CyaY [Rickettsiaceae bacterium]